MRPPRTDRSEKTYAEVLLAEGCELRNVSKAGVILSEACASLDDEVLTWMPDVVIVNFGVVEVCFRRTPRWLNNLTIRNYYWNRVLGRPYLFDSVFSRSLLLGLRLVNGATARLAALFGVKWQWLSHRRYVEVLDAVVRSVLKETSARVVVMGINPVSERVERILEGSREEIRKANEAVRELCLRLGQRVVYFDVGELIPSARADEFVPDGIHFSASGHKLVGDRLVELLHSWST